MAVVEYAHKSRCALGEGAVWDPHTGRLLWIDIVRGKLFSYGGGDDNRDLHLKQLLGTVVPLDKRRCVVAGVKGIAVVDLTTGEPTAFLGNPEAGSFSLRWNDGKCDPQGRLWVGSMNMQFGEPWVKKGEGALYCFEGSGDNIKIEKKLDGIDISNGLVWNKAGDTFYYIDTPTMAVAAFDFDGATGAISNRRVAIKFPEKDEGFTGYPDGCTIADDDSIFIAFWSGGCVGRYNPNTGTLIKKYMIPGATQVTSCAFGGPELDQLYVTTAAAGIPEDKLVPGAEQENAGHLFRLDLSAEGVKGVPAYSYAM